MPALRSATFSLLIASTLALTSLTNSSPKPVFNGILEQYVGILPPTTIIKLQTALTPIFAKYTETNALSTHTNAAILSVTASLSGNTVSGVESLEDCFELALQRKDYSLACILDKPHDYLVTGLNGIIEQFIGYFPPNIVADLQAGVKSRTPQSDLSDHFSNVLLSITASASGNTATYLELMEVCYRRLVKDGEKADITNCVKDQTLDSSREIVNGIIQQILGYLPPSVILDIEKATGSSSNPQLAKALDVAFIASGKGPASVTCLETLQDCIHSSLSSRSRRSRRAKLNHLEVKGLVCVATSKIACSTLV